MACTWVRGFLTWAILYAAHPLIAGGIMGFAGALFKVAANVGLAAVGVVTVPIMLQQKGEIYPAYSAYFKYTWHRMKSTCAWLSVRIAGVLLILILWKVSVLRLCGIACWARLMSSTFRS